MPIANWNGVTLAQSDDTLVLEGNHYFPRESVDERYLRPSTHETECFWKGTASYFDLEVDGAVNAAAAWSYVEPKARAEVIRGRVAFWRGVQVEE
jgi:uncharacterized protein (DUF427 family)